jgi:hypothetical protein
MEKIKSFNEFLNESVLNEGTAQLLKKLDKEGEIMVSDSELRDILKTGDAEVFQYWKKPKGSLVGNLKNKKGEYFAVYRVDNGFSVTRSSEGAELEPLYIAKK